MGNMMRGAPEGLGAMLCGIAHAVQHVANQDDDQCPHTLEDVYDSDSGARAPDLDVHGGDEEDVENGDDGTVLTMKAGGDCADDDGTECPICRDVLRSPRVPPCGHAVCASCLKTMVATAKTLRPDECMFGPSGGKRGLKCPECKKPVHEAQYVRCFALEKAVEKLHPSTDEEKQQRAESVEEVPLEKWTVSDLQRWTAAENERLIQISMRLIMEAVKECGSVSDALLINESLPCSKDSGDTPFEDEMMAMPMAMPMSMGHGSVRITSRRRTRRAGPPGATAGPSSAQELSKAWSLFWQQKSLNDVVGRLEKRGFRVALFKLHGEQHALLQWNPGA